MKKREFVVRREEEQISLCLTDDGDKPILIKLSGIWEKTLTLDEADRFRLALQEAIIEGRKSQ